MPSKFLKKKRQPTLKEKITKVWTKDIICLPNEYESEKEDIVIPRGSRRIELARLGLVGKVSLCSSMDFGEVQEEVRSVFKDSMGHKPSFAFKFLQPVGGGCRSLFDPQTSASFAWSAKDVVQSAENIQTVRHCSMMASISCKYIYLVISSLLYTGHICSYIIKTYRSTNALICRSLIMLEVL
jgi:hypothetical protein